MFQRKQLLLGAALLFATIATIPHDAHAWALPRIFHFPIEIIDPVQRPPYKAPTDDAWMRRATAATTAARRATPLAIRRATP